MTKNGAAVSLIITVCVLLACILGGCFASAHTPACDAPAMVDVSLDEAMEARTAAEQELKPEDSLWDTVQDVSGQMLPDASLDAISSVMPDAAACAEGDAPMVAVTFDDGPMAGSTERILDILEENGVRATFFVQGRQAVQYPDIVRRAFSMGCQIGNHTYSHKDLTALKDRDVVEQIESVNRLVEELTGEKCAVVRPPYGKGWRDKRVCGLVPYPMILWDIDTRDWSTRDADSTVSAALDKVKDGDIILMHDIYDETADAVRVIIPALLEKGYRLATVSELFAAKGPELSSGSAYRHAG